jgi:hypothetical protein
MPKNSNGRLQKNMDSPGMYTKFLKALRMKRAIIVSAMIFTSTATGTFNRISTCRIYMKKANSILMMWFPQKQKYITNNLSYLSPVKNNRSMLSAFRLFSVFNNFHMRNRFVQSWSAEIPIDEVNRLAMELKKETVQA